MKKVIAVIVLELVMLGSLAPSSLAQGTAVVVDAHNSATGQTHNVVCKKGETLYCSIGGGCICAK